MTHKYTLSFARIHRRRNRYSRTMAIPSSHHVTIDVANSNGSTLRDCPRKPKHIIPPNINRSTCIYIGAFLACITMVLLGFFLARSIDYEPITFNVELHDTIINFRYKKDQTMKNANSLKGLHMNPDQPILEHEFMKELLFTDK